MDTTNEGTSFDRPGFIESGESLLRRIAELEREVDKWKYAFDLSEQAVRQEGKRLAAAQATIQRKDEALRAIREDFASDKTITGRVQRQAEDAINLNSDRTALDAMLAEARKEGMLKAAGICASIRDEQGKPEAGHCAYAIRQAAERSAADNVEGNRPPRTDAGQD